MRPRTVSAAVVAGATLLAGPATVYAGAAQAGGTTSTTRQAGGIVTLASGVNGVALSPGQVIYTKRNARNESTVVRRFLVSSPGSVYAGPEHLLLQSTYVLSVGASSGRLYYGSKHRTYTGQVKELPAFTGPPWNASGNRALTEGRTGSPPSRWQTSFDARTNRPFPFPDGADDLSGSFIPYDDASGRIWLRNVSTGTSELVRGPAPRVGAIVNHGRRWVAWTTRCPSAAPCIQTVVIVDRFAGKVWTVRTRGTYTMDLSGGYLAIDAVPGAQSTRQLRAIRLGTNVPLTVGTLPENLGDSSSPDLIGEATPHFDLEDENIAWIDSGHVGRLKALAPFVDAPFYLGNLIAPASFSPNGDGRGDVWAMALPVSKAMPSCTVTISRGSTVVRTLNCANGNGMAFSAWNGRTASGAALPVGRYTIRVNGRDADGWLRHYDQQLKPVTFWVDKTA
jgi:hypothetical protein